MDDSNFSCPQCKTFLGNKRIFFGAWQSPLSPIVWQCEKCGATLQFSKGRLWVKFTVVGIAACLTTALVGKIFGGGNALGFAFIGTAVVASIFCSQFNKVELFS